MTMSNPTAAQIAQRETTAACIGCGADQLSVYRQGRYWLRLNRERGVGVCGACREFAAAWDAAHAFGPPHFDLVAHLHRQREFSARTFGPGPRTAGVVTHIRKELIEIEGTPGDLMEWVDVVLLALDGAWRAGHEPAAIALALATKQTRNELRTWPDWRAAAPDTAIEYVRGGASGLPQMYWCESCEADVDVNSGGCCIHCGDQAREPQA